MKQLFNSKFIGGVLLIIGTSIGGAVLGLPIATAQGDVTHAVFFLFFCWAFMAFGAYLILEVNLWLPRNCNMVSMVKETLGTAGEAFMMLCYGLLFYSLISAYIAGGSDLLHHMLLLGGINIPQWLDAVVFTSVLGFVVYKGIQSVDYVNRSLMTIKLGVYFLLITFILSHIDMEKLLNGHTSHLLGSISIMITSFGFAVIVPSLRTYFEDDVPKLRLAIMLGTLIPLVIYILWVVSIMGVLPRHGDFGLVPLLQSDHQISDLTLALDHQLRSTWITDLGRFFVSVSVLTSFLGVSLGLSDFVADGLKQEKRGKGALIVYGLTFIPPLLIALFYPGIFITALSYGGILCVIVLALIPALMAWRGRYKLNMATGYQVWGGKPALLVMMLLSFILIFVGFIPS